MQGKKNFVLGDRGQLIFCLSLILGGSAFAQDIYSPDLEIAYKTAEDTQAPCVNPGYTSDPVLFSIADCRILQGKISAAKAQVFAYPQIVNHTINIENAVQGDTALQAALVAARQNAHVYVGSSVDFTGADGEIEKAMDANDLMSRANSCRALMVGAYGGNIAPEDKAAGRAEESACSTLESGAQLVRDEKIASANSLSEMQAQNEIVFVHLDKIQVTHKTICVDANNNPTGGDPANNCQVAKKFCVNSNNQPVAGDPATCEKVCAVTGANPASGDKTPACPNVCADANNNLVGGDPNNCPANSKSVASMGVSSLGVAAAVVSETKTADVVAAGASNLVEKPHATAGLQGNGFPMNYSNGKMEAPQQPKQNIQVSPAKGEVDGKGGGIMAGAAGASSGHAESAKADGKIAETKDGIGLQPSGSGLEGFRAGSASSVTMPAPFDDLRGLAGAKNAQPEMAAGSMRAANVAQRFQANQVEAPQEQKEDTLFDRIHSKYLSLNRGNLISGSIMGEHLAASDLKQYP